MKKFTRDGMAARVAIRLSNCGVTCGIAGPATEGRRHQPRFRARLCDGTGVGTSLERTVSVGVKQHIHGVYQSRRWP